MKVQSKAQLEWINSPEGLEALGEEKVKALNLEAQGMNLPERALSTAKTRTARPSSAPSPLLSLKGGRNWMKPPPR